MLTDKAHAYRALVSRDARFDGVFFVGVSTTSIYCRPICPARTPREERCTFFASAALAESAGFRACFRCRPELAPGSASVDACSRLALEGSLRFDAGALDHGGSMETLAASLGVSSRHLRRVMESELGVAPHALAESRRLATAKQLLTDTTLSMAQVAFTSGFGSVRRFNDAFQKRFGSAPRKLGGSVPSLDSRSVTLKLAYRAPFDWQGLLHYLGPRAIPQLEEVQHGVWRRLVHIDGKAGIVEVRNAPEVSQLHARIPTTLFNHIRMIAIGLRHVFDLDAQPDRIAVALGAALAEHVKRSPGLRVPGCLDPFELAVRAILGQQVSVRGASTLAGRLVQRFGEKHATDDALCMSFPSASRLAETPSTELAKIGLPLKRAETIRMLAERVCKGEVTLSPALRNAHAVENTMRTLCDQAGIGPWTAEYIAMRALRWPDAFVAGDLGVRKAMGLPDGPISEREARARAEAFRPYRAYAVLHLWNALT